MSVRNRTFDIFSPTKRQINIVDIDPENNVKINTFIFPYFIKNFPEKTVKIDAEITPIVIKISPLIGCGAVGSINSLKQK